MSHTEAPALPDSGWDWGEQCGLRLREDGCYITLPKKTHRMVLGNKSDSSTGISFAPISARKQ